MSAKIKFYALCLISVTLGISACGKDDKAIPNSGGSGGAAVSSVVEALPMAPDGVLKNANSQYVLTSTDGGKKLMVVELHVQGADPELILYRELASGQMEKEVVTGVTRTQGEGIIPIRQAFRATYVTHDREQENSQVANFKLGVKVDSKAKVPMIVLSANGLPKDYRILRLVESLQDGKLLAHPLIIQHYTHSSSQVLQTELAGNMIVSELTIESQQKSAQVIYPTTNQRGYFRDVIFASEGVEQLYGHSNNVHFSFDEAQQLIVTKQYDPNRDLFHVTAVSQEAAAAGTLKSIYLTKEMHATPGVALLFRKIIIQADGIKKNTTIMSDDVPHDQVVIILGDKFTTNASLINPGLKVLPLREYLFDRGSDDALKAFDQLSLEGRLAESLPEGEATIAVVSATQFTDKKDVRFDWSDTPIYINSEIPGPPISFWQGVKFEGASNKADAYFNVRHAAITDSILAGETALVLRGAMDTQKSYGPLTFDIKDEVGDPLSNVNYVLTSTSPYRDTAIRKLTSPSFSKGWINIMLTPNGNLDQTIDNDLRKFIFLHTESSQLKRMTGLDLDYNTVAGDLILSDIATIDPAAESFFGETLPMAHRVVTSVDSQGREVVNMSVDPATTWLSNRYGYTVSSDFGNLEYVLYVDPANNAWRYLGVGAELSAVYDMNAQQLVITFNNAPLPATVTFYVLKFRRPQWVEVSGIFSGKIVRRRMYWDSAFSVIDP